MPNLKFLLALGFAGLTLAACKPQNPVPTTQLSIASSGTSVTAAAIDIQSNGTRHEAFTEGTTGVWTIYLRRNEGVPILVATTSLVDNLNVEALDDGRSVLAWAERAGLEYIYRWVVVTGGTVGPIQALGNAPNSTLNHVRYGSDTPRLAAGASGSVYAVYRTGDEGAMKLFYQRLRPTFGAPVQLDDSAPGGAAADLSGAVLDVDRFDNVHVAWRRDRGALSQSSLHYARGGPSFLLDTAIAYSVTNAVPHLPGIVVDDKDATVRAHVGYIRSASTGTEFIESKRYDNGALNSTRSYTLTGFDIQSVEYPAGYPRPIPELTVDNARNAVLAFAARETGQPSQAYIWDTLGPPERISTAGHVENVRAVSMISGSNFPLFAYVAVTGADQGLYVFDWLNRRTVIIDAGRLCGGFRCDDDRLDLAAHDTHMAGVWPRAGKQFVTHNDLSPSGNLIVNTNADSNLADGVISLREALLVANGSLTTSFSAAEKTQLETAGCVFGGANIVNGCGRGITDTITLSLTQGSVITLGSLLPAINDSRPTRLNGARELGGIAEVLPLARADAFGRITLFAPPALAQALLITSAGNRVSELSIIGARIGISITGNSNGLESVDVVSNSVAAVAVTGDDNQIFGLVAGINLNNVFSAGCAQGTETGVWLRNGASGNRVINGGVGCARGNAVHIEGAGTISNQLSNLFLGGAPFGVDGAILSIPNLGSGVRINGGASFNTIDESFMLFNNQHGVLIEDTATRHTAIRDSVILSNNQSGVHIVNAQFVTLTGNSIGGHGDAGIALFGLSNSDHFIAANLIGAWLSTTLPNAHGIFANPTTRARIEENLLINNRGAGVYLNTGSTGVAVMGTIAISNAGAGFLFNGTGTTNNVLDRIGARGNSVGIRESNGATNNIWVTMLANYDNVGLGIDKGVAGVTTPTVTIISFDRATRTLRGTAAAGAGIDVYRPAPDPTGFGEAALWLAAGSATVGGAFEIIVPVGDLCFTLVETSAGSSSEFSRNWCATRPVFLPLASR